MSVSIPSRIVTDSTGASHPMVLVGNNTWRSADGSGYVVKVLDSQDDMQVTSPDGTVNYTGVTPSNCGQIDANGNILYGANGNTQCGTTDTMGRASYFKFSPIAQTGSSAHCTGPLPVVSTSTISVPTYNGGTATYTACYASINVTTYYDLSDGTSQSASMSVMQSLVLPDNTAWGFTYESGTGNLTKITTPLSGSISYQWGYPDTSGCSTVPNVNGSVVSRTFDPNDGSPTQPWTYAWTAGTGGSTDWSVKVTDPLQNDTVTQFLAVGGYPCSYYPSVTTTYDGSASSGTPRRTVATDYITTSLPWYVGITGVYPIRTTTTQDNFVKKSEMDYDSGFTASQGTSDGQMGGPSFTVRYGKVIARRDYDWGAANTVGPLLRQISTQYKAFNDANYLNANLMNLVSSMTVMDGSGNQTSQTTYGYDETSVVSSGITAQLGPAPGGTIRGDLTSERHWLSGSTPVSTSSCTPNLQGGYLVTTHSYFDTGELQQTIDPCQHTTTFGYDPAYLGAYQTSVTTVLGTTSKSYDFNTGVVKSSTDLNSQITSFDYQDPLVRVTDVTLPQTFNGTHGNVHTVYSGNTATVTTKLSDSISKTTSIQVNGLAKLTTSTLVSDPEGADYTTTAYDVAGNPNVVSNPTRCAAGTSCSEATAGTTQSSFDSLGRPTLVVPPDGSSSSNNMQYSYAGNNTTVRDQTGVSKQQTVDALGRISIVVESGAGQTQYFYDANGNLTCVEQHGGVTGTGCSSSQSQDATSPWRVRRFTYDSLGRLLTSRNPETGPNPITYTYDANGNVVTKTDGRAITTTYGYDTADRLTQKTYSNGDPTVTYTYDAHGPYNLGIGRRTGMTDGSGSTVWQYDAGGRIVSEAITIGSHSQTILTAPYLDGSPYRITYPSQNVVTYNIGASGQSAGRVLSVTDSAGNNYAGSLLYEPGGAMKSELLGATTSFAGIHVSHDYNDRLQPTLFQAWTAPGTLMSLAYDFHLGTGDNGNLYHLTNVLDSTRSLTYTYDLVNRLQSAHGDGVTPATPSAGTVHIIGAVPVGCARLGLTCDSGTVSVTVGGVTESVSYGQGSNQIGVINALASAFTNDPNSPVNGSGGATLTLTSKVAGSGTGYALSASVSDDGENNPAFSVSTSGSTLTGGTDATVAPGQLNTTYTSDAWGNMVISGINAPTVSSTNNRFNEYCYDNAGNVTFMGTAAGQCQNSPQQYTWNAESQLAAYSGNTYVYNGDGERVQKTGGTTYWGGLAESDPSGALTEYVFVNGTRVARRDPSGAVYYYIGDNLGNSNLVTDATGNVVNSSDFYPFGQEHILTQNLSNQHFQYTGKERDVESGLDDFGARYYNWRDGRFLSADWAAKAEPVPYAKLDDPQSLNLYAYMRNNPMNGTDPDGHFPTFSSRSPTLAADIADDRFVSPFRNPDRLEDSANDEENSSATEQYMNLTNAVPSQKPKDTLSSPQSGMETLNLGGVTAQVEYHFGIVGANADGTAMTGVEIDVKASCTGCAWMQVVTRTGDTPQPAHTDKLEGLTSPIAPNPDGNPSHFFDTPSNRSGNGGTFAATLIIGTVNNGKTFATRGAITYGFSVDRQGNVKGRAPVVASRSKVSSAVNVLKHDNPDWTIH